MKRIVIFDFDGTLVDSDYAADDAIVSVCEQLRLHSVLSQVRPHLYRPRPRSVPIFTKLSLPASFERSAIVDALKIELRRRVASSTLYPGIKALLQELKNQENILAVATGTDRNRFEQLSEKEGVLELIDRAVCAGEAAKKPAPDMLKVITDCWKQTPAVFVGNSSIDSEAAQRAGIPFIWANYTEREVWEGALLECTFRAKSVADLADHLLQ